MPSRSSSNNPVSLLLDGVDFSHVRLVDLTRLAESAEPFYRWIERVFQRETKRSDSLSRILITEDLLSLSRLIETCYHEESDQGRPLPQVYDGAGRPYTHRKACFLFFGWIVRDAPQQRLQPLISRLRQERGIRGSRGAAALEAEVFAHLIVRYREILRTFSWEAVREVVIDRLEGSRRVIKGLEKEALVRTTLLAILHELRQELEGYGQFDMVSIPKGTVTVDGETFDVAAEMTHADPQQSCWILVPVKTRETEGGGHSYLYTRDVKSAVHGSVGDLRKYVIPFIVAQSWNEKTMDQMVAASDLVLCLQANPSEFACVPDDLQTQLKEFLRDVMTGAR